MIELRISEAAAHSIVEQADYYIQSSNTEMARRWEESVDEAVKSLLLTPERGTLCRFRLAALKGLRWVFVPGFPKHMVFYLFIPENSVLRIVQVLHGARDIETILGEAE